MDFSTLTRLCRNIATLPLHRADTGNQTELDLPKRCKLPPGRVFRIIDHQTSWGCLHVFTTAKRDVGGFRRFSHTCICNMEPPHWFEWVSHVIHSRQDDVVVGREIQLVLVSEDSRLPGPLPFKETSQTVEIVGRTCQTLGPEVLVSKFAKNSALQHLWRKAGVTRSV